jgi:hypothetical protein
MRRPFGTFLVAALTMTVSAIGVSPAAAAGPPNTLSPPKGLNLGSTSFFDGLGRQSQGWTFVEYGRFEDLSRINGPTGAPNPHFKEPRIAVGVALTQLIYTTDWRPFGGHVAISAALPVVDFVRSDFAADSPVKLTNNGTGIGDLVWGPIFQSKVYMKGGRPRFVWRAQLIVSSPTGTVNRFKDQNQGTGYWAIDPYLAFSYFPTAKLEVSNRLNYQYDFTGHTFSNPPPIPGFVYASGRAGQLLYDNFAASYAVAPRLNLGIAGYALDQLTPNRTNGIAIAGSREKELYIGPGAHLKIDDTNSLNLNLYLKVISRDAVSGTKVSSQFIHRF